MTAIKKGFTLIELLIVMAILGVLAVVVLVAINPAEQLARARDSGRISAANQLGRALAAYFTGQSEYPAVGSWNDDLTRSQDISSFPAAVAPETTDDWCGLNVFNGYCYDTGLVNNQDHAIAFSQLVSQQQINKCASGDPFSLFSTFDARGGVVCSTGDPTIAGAPFDFED
jgi:prepilin-type N-terminal cleavage/methylation domain-containing protein